MRPLAVRRERQRTVDAVQHASAHRYQQRLDVRVNARLLECMNPAVGERKVDRAAGVHVHFAQVGPTLMQQDPSTLPRHEDGHERAR